MNSGTTGATELADPLTGSFTDLGSFVILVAPITEGAWLTLTYLPTLLTILVRRRGRGVSPLR